jgi:hypothetical protein
VLIDGESEGRRGAYVAALVLFFEVNNEYIKLASRLIKKNPIPLGTLVRKIVCLKLEAAIKIWLHRL